MPNNENIYFTLWILSIRSKYFFCRFFLKSIILLSILLILLILAQNDNLLDILAVLLILNIFKIKIFQFIWHQIFWYKFWESYEAWSEIFNWIASEFVYVSIIPNVCV